MPATNVPDTVARCLTALDRAQARDDERFVVLEPRLLGPAAARNLAARKATGDVLVFVDSDVEVHADALDRMRAAFAEDPQLVALFGSYDDAPAARGTVSRFRNLLHHHNHQTQPGAAETFWTGLGAVRREAFLALGGFDERFTQPSIEDVEFGMRLHATGATIRLDPAILGKHLKHWGLVNMVRTDLLLRGVPWVALLASRRQSSSISTGPRHRASALSALGVTAGLALRRPRIAATGTAATLAINHGLYRLLWRRLGSVRCAAALPLHVVHQLTAVASVPLGLVTAARRRGADQPEQVPAADAAPAQERAPAPVG